MPPGVAHSLLGVPVLRTWGTRAWFRRPVTIFALTVLTGSVGACAGGDTPPAAPPAAASAAASPAPQPEFCGAVIDLLQVLEVGPDISSTSTPQDVATALQAFGAQVEPPLATLERAMPDLIRPDVETLGRQARSAVATKTSAPLDTPEVDAALSRLRVNSVRQCGIKEVRVISNEYRYEGMPSNLVGGAFDLTLINLGVEPHEMRVFRIQEGEQRPFATLIALPQDQADDVLTLVEPTPSAKPGSNDADVIKLTPGRYGIACLQTQGSTPTADGSGPLHATLGEAAEFTVQ